MIPYTEAVSERFDPWDHDPETSCRMKASQLGSIMKHAVLLTLVAFILSGPEAGQVLAQRAVASTDAQSGVTKNPFSSTADVDAGEQSFRARCAICHGVDGTGDRGPDLTRGVFRHGDSDRSLFMNILAGIPGTGMPSVRLSDREMWQIVAYVRSLNLPVDNTTSGDAAAGLQVFDRLACGRCHFINGQGGRTGPDLSAVGWIRSENHLRTSVLDPSASIEADFRQVQVTTRQGQQTQGILLNEDRYSVQLIDRQQQLRSFMKSELDTVDRPDGSLMPSFEGRLSTRDLDDLVTFLASLRRR